MKSFLLSAFVFFMTAAALNAAPVLFEAYQEGTITIPQGEQDNVTVAEVSFWVDSVCYALLTTGGMAVMAKTWFELDEESLPPLTYVIYNEVGPVNMTYTCLLTPGEHTISFRLSSYLNVLAPTICTDGYLQALIFLPDAGGAIAERPAGDTEPLPNTPSVLSSGPYVNVTGASELVDSSGRIIENAISEDKVYISNLPTGTYFARDGERTVVKIVKVE